MEASALQYRFLPVRKSTSDNYMTHFCDRQKYWLLNTVNNGNMKLSDFFFNSKYECLQHSITESVEIFSFTKHQSAVGRGPWEDEYNMIDSSTPNLYAPVFSSALLYRAPSAGRNQFEQLALNCGRLKSLINRKPCKFNCNEEDDFDKFEFQSTSYHYIATFILAQGRVWMKWHK